MRISLLAGLSLGLFAMPAALPAQSPDFALKAAELSGAMHAAAKVCQDYTDEELRDLKATQKAHAAAAGMSAARFEAAFQAHYDQARAKLATATPAEREKACQQVRAMAGMMKAG